MLPDFTLWICILPKQHDTQRLRHFMYVLSYCYSHTLTQAAAGKPFLQYISQRYSFYIYLFSLNNWQMCVCVIILSFKDGVGEHWGDAGHVFRDRCHILVPSHGNGGCLGVCQLPQLQWDRSGEEHVFRRPNEAVPAPRCVNQYFSQFSFCCLAIIDIRLCQGCMWISSAWWYLCQLYIPLPWHLAPTNVTRYKSAQPPAHFTHFTVPVSFQCVVWQWGTVWSAGRDRGIEAASPPSPAANRRTASTAPPPPARWHTCTQ